VIKKFPSFYILFVCVCFFSLLVLTFWLAFGLLS
jgi:hypothetical protein